MLKKLQSFWKVLFITINLTAFSLEHTYAMLPPKALLLELMFWGRKYFQVFFFTKQLFIMLFNWKLNIKHKRSYNKITGNVNEPIHQMLAVLKNRMTKVNLNWRCQKAATKILMEACYAHAFLSVAILMLDFRNLKASHVKHDI